VLFSLVLALTAAGAAVPAPLLLVNASVYVSAGDRPRAASILISGGRVQFVGDAAEARSRGRGAEVVDLGGRPVFPGWTDAHGHLLGLGKALDVAKLRGAASAAEAARRVADAARTLAPATWAEGRGWDQNLWPGGAFPDARDLDAVLPDRPAIARRVDGHAVWVNSAALKVAGITSATPDPPGGRILRRPDGSPSGVFVDNAVGLIERAAGAGHESPAEFERRILSAARACARVGLTQVQDASAYGPEEVDSLKKLAASGALPIRIYATVSPEPRRLAAAFAKGTHIGGGADFLTVRAVKSYADGALGSRGAALLSDYSDEPGNRGLLVTPPERLDELARQTREKGWQLWVHAIGDRGNRIALDAFAKARATVPRPPDGGDRPRIEHAQVIALEDIPRFAKEGVIASIQPTHATSDMPWAERRVGPERIRGAYAWRRLATAGARLAGGSDFPVESENPLLGFYAAITRQDVDGRPPGGWRPEEKLTRSEALALFTSDAAWAAFEESRRGRIAPGFEADLTVLSADPMTAPVRDVPGITAVLTIVGGRIAWDGRPGAGAPK
jgi:predicted amidohydrolase YtcJ